MIMNLWISSEKVNKIWFGIEKYNFIKICFSNPDQLDLIWKIESFECICLWSWKLIKFERKKQIEFWLEMENIIFLSKYTFQTQNSRI